MTTRVAPHPTSAPAARPARFAAAGRRLGRSSWGERAFVVGIGVVCLHGLACWIAGTPRERALAMVAVSVTVASCLLYVEAGRGIRSALAAIVGLPALALGAALYASHAVMRGVGGADATGLLLIPAGALLTGLAVHDALCGRARRWWAALLPVAFVYAQWGFLPLLSAGLATAAPHTTIASAASLGIPGARDVAFAGADGTPLAGWYVPGRTGRAVIVLHGSHGSRADTLHHLRMLHGLGYTVLAYDARGHGGSHGQTNALGWAGDSDLAGAVAFLGRQPIVLDRAIAALGLSMGAESALRAAAGGIPLAAVIADGAGASTLGDATLVDHGATQPILDSTTWLSMRETELISGDSEPAPLKSLTERVRVPVLLIASNAPDERAIDQALARRIGQRAEVWYLADTGHTQALQVHPAAYRDRVAAFLDGALR